MSLITPKLLTKGVTAIYELLIIKDIVSIDYLKEQSSYTTELDFSNIFHKQVAEKVLIWCRSILNNNNYITIDLVKLWETHQITIQTNDLDIVS